MGVSGDTACVSGNQLEKTAKNGGRKASVSLEKMPRGKRPGTQHVAAKYCFFGGKNQLRDTARRRITPLGFGFVIRALPIQTWDLTAVLTNSDEGDQPVAPSRGCTVLENESLPSSYCCQFATKWLSSVENRQNSNIPAGNALQLRIALAPTKAIFNYLLLPF